MKEVPWDKLRAGGPGVLGDQHVSGAAVGGSGDISAQMRAVCGGRDLPAPVPGEAAADTLAPMACVRLLLLLGEECGRKVCLGILALLGCFRSCRADCGGFGLFWFCPLEEVLITPRKPVIFVFQMFMPPSVTQKNLILVLFSLWRNPLSPPILLVPLWFFRAGKGTDEPMLGQFCASGVHDSVSS